MKEIIITKIEKNVINGWFQNFTVEKTIFLFNGIEGRFTKTTFDEWVEYEVCFMTGYAIWNSNSDIRNTCFGNTTADLTDFMSVFKERFGIEIPTV